MNVIGVDEDIKKLIERSSCRERMIEKDDVPRLLSASGIKKAFHDGILSRLGSPLNGYDIFNGITYYLTHIYPYESNFDPRVSYEISTKSFNLLRR